MSDNSLFQALEELCRFLDDAGLHYTLVGGLAVGIWAAPRATVDVDFLVSLPAGEPGNLVRRLNQSGQFIFVHEKPMVFNKVSFIRATLKSNSDIAVDFLFADDEFKKSMLDRSSSITIAGFSVRIPTPEDLIILKLLSGRAMDLIDAEQIRGSQKHDLDEAYIRSWCDRLGLTLK
jgi:predicted nucleotidyltransferase